jgi:tRNA 5-methylaminomethyl-2-thiouridine biosynthesis bifunctional protein
LDWSEAGVPRAAGFDDVYFSREGGLAESDAVFLAGCGLPEAWRGKDRFAVCELGFGAGLNVLALWRAWKIARSAHAILHVSTIEAFPLARADAARALSHFPEIADFAAQLLARWPVRAYAPQRFWFENDGFALTLHTGEAESVLAGMSGGFDAWFLDGFAPARNETMWSEAVFAHIARLSNAGARAATFTVAGSVRRGLEAVGFSVEKRPGFGTKRERLEARLERKERGSSDPHLNPASGDAGLKTRAPFFPYAPAHPKRVAILGAGIAGAACARALTRRGVETVVLEAETALGAGASGNPAGLVMPRLDRGEGPARELYLAAYLEAVSIYEALGADVYRACGVEQSAESRAAEALADLLADPPLPDDWLSARGRAAWHARAGVVRPQAAVNALLRGATLMLEAPVETLQRSGGGWVLRAPDGRAMLKADAVVLACGAALSHFAPAAFLPIALSRGQIEWGESALLSHVLTRGAYVAPFEGGVLFGATFDPFDADANEDAMLVDARARNLSALAQLAPEIAASVKLNTLHSRAGVRATTPDRMPIAGLLPDAAAWLTQYAALAHGGVVDETKLPPAHEGVYVIGGLGARGLTLAPLLGERLAAEMCAEPQILSQSVLNAIHPARFLQRTLKRR